MERENVGVVGLGLINISIMAGLLALVFLGTAIEIAPIMNVIKFASPLLLIMVAIGGAMIIYQLARLKKWQKVGKAGLPPNFGKVHPKFDPLFYILDNSTYFLIVVLLVATAHFGTGFIWLVIWLIVAIYRSAQRDIRKAAPNPENKKETSDAVSE